MSEKQISSLMKKGEKLYRKKKEFILVQYSISKDEK